MDLLKRSAPDASRVFCPEDGFSKSILHFGKTTDCFTRILGFKGKGSWIMTSEKRVVSRRVVLAHVLSTETSSKRSFPAALPWQKKAMIFDNPGPQKNGTRAHSPKPPFYKTAPLFPLDQRHTLDRNVENLEKLAKTRGGEVQILSGLPCLQILVVSLEELNLCLKSGSAQISEEDKRATTNVQNGLVFFFLFSFILFYSLLFSFILFYSLLFSFILFYSLLSKRAVKPLNSKKKSWRKNSEKLWKSVKMCGKLPKSVKKCRDDFAL